MYGKLNKEEKKIIRDKYSKSKRGNNNLPIYRRLFIEGVLMIFCALILFVAIFTEGFGWWAWIASICFALVGLIFIVAQFLFKRKEYNNFIKKGTK